MNATDIDTQLIALQKQMEALKALKEEAEKAKLTPPPPPPVETSEEEARKLHEERMEEEMCYYIDLKVRQLETDANCEFDFNSYDGEISTTIKRRSIWNHEKFVELIKDEMDEKTRQLTQYNDHGIDYEWDISETDTNDDEEPIEWEITLSWRVGGELNHGLDSHYITKEQKAMLEDPEAFDWSKFGV